MNAPEEFLDSLVGGDRRRAQQIVDAEIDRGESLRTVYLQILQPAMREIGRRWQENELTVAEEHRATAIAQAVMGRAFERLYQWRDHRSPSLIAACADEERHQLGLRMLCDLLELEGWDTTYLGASVPLESLVEMVEKRKPDVVALSVTIAPHLPRVRATVAAIRGSARIERQPLIIVGGRAVNGNESLAKNLGADLTAVDGAHATELLRTHVNAAA